MNRVPTERQEREQCRCSFDEPLTVGQTQAQRIGLAPLDDAVKATSTRGACNNGKPKTYVKDQQTVRVLLVLCVGTNRLLIDDASRVHLGSHVKLVATATHISQTT